MLAGKSKDPLAAVVADLHCELCGIDTSVSVAAPAVGAMTKMLASFKVVANLTLLQTLVKVGMVIPMTLKRPKRAIARII